MKARTKAAKRRQREARGQGHKPKGMTPGYMRLPEDRAVVSGAMSLASIPRERSKAVEPTERVFISTRDVEARLMAAMKTLRALPDNDVAKMRMKGASIPYIQEYLDAYNSTDVRVPVYVPSPRDVSDYLVALSWVRHLDKRLWKVMWLRSFEFSFGLIGRYIGRSDETVRRWFREGITDAWTTANGSHAVLQKRARPLQGG